MIGITLKTVQARMVLGVPPKNAQRIEDTGTCGAVFSMLPDGTLRVLVFVPDTSEEA